MSNNIKLHDTGRCTGRRSGEVEPRWLLRCCGEVFGNLRQQPGSEALKCEQTRGYVSRQGLGWETLLRIRLIGFAMVFVLAGLHVRATDEIVAASRILPASFAPNSTNLVSINYAMGPGGIAATITDSPPAGWGVVMVSSNGYYDVVANLVRFGPLHGGQAGTVTYQIVPPVNQTGAGTFGGGILTVDGSAYPVGGAASLPPLPPNRAPLVTLSTSTLRVLEDSPPFSLNTFAALSANEATQTIASVSLTAETPGLFLVQPMLTASGQLTFTPAPNAYGTNTITVVATDNGGTANGGVDSTTNTFVIEIQAINDAPAFAVNSNLLSAPTLPSPSLWYPFNGNANDASGNGHHALLQGATSFETAGGVTGLRLNNPAGSSEIRAQLPGTPGISALGNGSFTVAIRYKTTDLTHGRMFGAGTSESQRIAMNYLMGGFGGSLADPATRPVASVQALGASIPESAWSSVPRTADGNWHWQIIAVDRVQRSVSFYVDSVLAGVATIPDALLNAGVDLAGAWIGGTPAYSGHGLIGTVDDFRIYTNALSSSQVGLLLGQASEATLVGSLGENQFGGILTNLLAGPANEVGQTLRFDAIVGNPALFSTPPTFGSDGVLRFVAVKEGLTRLTFSCQDSGGKADGGVDRSVTNQFSLLVQSGLLGPTIATAPGGALVDSLTNVTFSVKANGSKLRFQWQKDGVDVPGATASELSLSAVTTNDNGSYRVIVSNTQSSITSSPPAVLVVNRRAQTLVFEALEDRRVGSGLVTLDAGTSSGLDALYTSTVPTVAAISGRIATLVGVGTTTIIASQPGNAAYFPANSVTQSFTVLPPPQPGYLHFAAQSASVSEGQGTATVIIRRAGGSDGPASVKCRMAGGSAELGTDFQFAERLLLWRAGEMGDQSVVVTIVNDREQEPDKTVELLLAEATGAELATPKAFLLNLLDDDNTPPKVSLALAGGTLVAPASFTLVADAFDVNGVAKLEFIEEGTNILGAFAASSASLTVEGRGEGKRAYTVRATDRKGLSATSDPLVLIIRRNSTNDMSLHLPMDGDFGDASGNGRDGSTHGETYAFIPGAIGSGVQFEELKTNGIAVPVIQPGTESLSISAWVRVESSTFFHPGTPERIPVFTLQSGDFTNGARLFLTRQAGLLGVGFQVADGSGIQAGTAQVGPLPGQWHFLAGILDRASQTGTLYLDGSTIGSFSISAIGSLLPTSLLIGGGQLVNGEFMRHSGQLDDVRVFPRALTAAEVRGLAGLSPTVLLPILLRVPQESVKNHGDTVTLTVDASSRSPITYQWSKDGSPIPGATNTTLTLANLQTNSNGAYSVIASNHIGAVSSPPARLIVLPPQPTGVLQFGASTIVAAEAVGVLLVPLVRSSGAFGEASASVVIEGGTAVTNRDYREFVSRVAWEGGEEGTKTITVPVIDNSSTDGDRTMFLRLSSTQGAALGSNVTVSITITDDDFLPPVVTLIASGTNFTAPANYSLSVSATVPGGIVGLELYENGTRLGQAQTNPAAFLVAGRAPGSYEYRGRAMASNGVAGETAAYTVVVHGPRAPGSLMFAATRYAVSEGGGAVTLGVNRVGGSDGNVSIAYTTLNGTALAGLDFRATNGILTWSAGATESKSITVGILEDAIVEGAEQFAIQLTDPTGGAGLGSNSLATIEIQDNDSVPEPSFVSRVLPTNYTPGIEFTVTLSVTPPTNILSYAIEDVPPSGWRAQSPSSGGVYDEANKKVKFFFTDPNSRTLSYRVIPVGGTVTPREFAGTVLTGAVYRAIGGARLISANGFHPADLPPKFRIVTSNVVDYADAWKRGIEWPTGPNPIPASFVNRAAYLWMFGERYKVDAGLSSPPEWWRSETLAPAAVSSAVVASLPRQPASLAITGLGIRVLPATYAANQPLVVELRFAPPVGGGSYLVIERPPTNWRIQDVSNQGVYDPSAGVIKWGFLSGPSTNTYVVIPPAGELGLRTFSGSAPWDDGTNIEDVPILGATNISDVIPTAARITTQPQPVTASVGSTATFSVAASGTAPIGYQWQRDGTPIPGATTASLTLTNVQSTAQGLYSVVVANVSGSEPSRAVSLSLAPFSSLEVTILGKGAVLPAGGDFANGQHVQLSASSSNGWVFQGWQGAVTGNLPVATVTMNGLTPVTAEFRDLIAPTITIAQPGVSGTNEQITLAGTVSDNDGISAAWWGRNNEGLQVLPLANGSFSVANVTLFQTGTNVLRVIARDFSGNFTTNSVVHVWTPPFALVLSPRGQVREGFDVTVPVELTSPGGVNGIFFRIYYRSEFFKNPLVRPGDSSGAILSSLTVVTNTLADEFYDRELVVSMVYAGRIAPGTRAVANLQFRARSVPFGPAYPVGVKLTGARVTAFPNDSFPPDSEVDIPIVQRTFVGDIGGRLDRIDLTDATAMLEMVAGVADKKPYDTALNKLVPNQGSELGLVDVLAALRIVTGIDPQPNLRVGGGVVGAAVAKSPVRRTLAVELGKVAATVESPTLTGQLQLLPRWINGQLQLTVWLVGNPHPLRGINWTLAYSTNLLQMVHFTSGPLVTGLPQFQSERVLHTEGLTHVAAGAGNSITNNGLLATLVFNATPDNPAYTFLPFSVNGEIAINSEGDTVAVVGSPLSLQLVNGSIGRVPLRMLDARRKSGGQFSLTVDQGFSGFIEPLDPGRHGEVEVWVSESLGRATNWIRLPNPLLIPGADGLLQVEDAPGPNLPRRFYQLRDP